MTDRQQTNRQATAYSESELTANINVSSPSLKTGV